MQTVPEEGRCRGCRELPGEGDQLRSNLTALWSEKMLGMISIFLNLPRLDLWPRM